MTKLASKLVLDGVGSYLGMEKGCFVVKDRFGEVERFPLFDQDIGEVILKSGNSISTGALASFGFWDIDVLVMTQRGRPVAQLRSLDDDSHVDVYVAQVQASLDKRAFEICRNLVIAKLQTQNLLLMRYGLEPHGLDFIDRVEAVRSSDIELFRRSLNGVEGSASRAYYGKIFSLLPDGIAPGGRETFQCYNGVNNMFNLCYEILAWKVQKALVRAHLISGLGFLHSSFQGKLSLVCDFQELYRSLVDQFVIEYSKRLGKRDFVAKVELGSHGKKGKREYLSDSETATLLDELNDFFERKVEVKRIRNGEYCTIETLINEEALLFARYLRGESQSWVPRVAFLA